VFSKEHQKGTYKLEMSSVSTPLDILLQPVRHTVHHVAQARNFEVLPAFGLFFGIGGLRVWFCIGQIFSGLSHSSSVFLFEWKWKNFKS
jgi:hypothetical protein